MNYFIAAVLLYYFNAGTGWWVGFVSLIFMEIGLIGYRSYKEATKEPIYEATLKDIIKLDGTPYTYEDLQNIWNHGYQNGYNNAHLTKQ
jgi:hypothetical protein